MPKSLAGLIEKYLAEKKMSAYQLAKLSRTAESTISRIRRGEMGASVSKAIVLADTLGASRYEFLEAAGHFDAAARYRPLPPPVSTPDTGEAKSTDDRIRELLFKLGASIGRLDDKSERHKLMLLRNLEEMYQETLQPELVPPRLDLEEEIAREMPHNRPKPPRKKQA